ncbi:DUF5810 domain-containing protein [Halovenus rubra]|uniref:DUF5810 domain-containing protein n=2 Tax=Halovenus rubra TaxID=869890 RepID=A0ACC7E3S5_9EURY|nr:DUF5810 domain-containing protein [Halovenus rubra]
MGYSCPVCGDPQADARHLANHLAFTALVRGGDHEDWLDEHVPDWESMDEESLAPEVTEIAEETEYPQVFEDTAAQRDHTHENKHTHTQGSRSGVPDEMSLADLPDEKDLSSEATDAIEQARELTEKRRQSDSDDDS